MAEYTYYNKLWSGGKVYGRKYKGGRIIANNLVEARQKAEKENLSWARAFKKHQKVDVKPPKVVDIRVSGKARKRVFKAKKKMKSLENEMWGFL